MNVAAPLQCAHSTRAGCECIAHALQAMTELDPESTIMSIDGISGCDTMSRKAMLEGLEKVAGGRLFYSSPSSTSEKITQVWHTRSTKRARRCVVAFSVLRGPTRSPRSNTKRIESGR